MTTTTSTTGSTTAASATSAISTATQQLLTSLDTGSGVDTSSLVTNLVQAEFASQTDALKTQSDTLTAQLSGVATLKSTITSFSTALATLTKNGTLTSQLTSSDSAVVAATVTDATKLSTGSRSITVTALATAQAAQTTTSVDDRTAKQFSGSFTITLGGITVAKDGTVTQAGGGTPVTFKVSNASLDDIAKAITANGKGMTANVVTDAKGHAFLSIKGATGFDNGFTITTTTDPAPTTGADAPPSLTMFDVGDGASRGATISAQATDAELTVDGISVTRASNTVTDLIDGTSLALTKTGSVTLTSSTPTDALSQAVGDFVDTYNEVLATVTGLTDPISGALRSDPAAKALLRNLKQLTGTKVLSGTTPGTPGTLAEIGVNTNRDGTLAVDTSKLSSALATWPQAIGAMFAQATTTTSLSGATTATGDGVSALLINLAATSTDQTYGLGASATTYTAQQTKVSSDQDDLTTKSAAETTRLTQQFASMNSKVSAYKSTQTFLQNQIDAWNSKN